MFLFTRVIGLLLGFFDAFVKDSPRKNISTSRSQNIFATSLLYKALSTSKSLVLTIIAAPFTTCARCSNFSYFKQLLIKDLIQILWPNKWMDIRCVWCLGLFGGIASDWTLKITTYQEPGFF